MAVCYVQAPRQSDVVAGASQAKVPQLAYSQGLPPTGIPTTVHALVRLGYAAEPGMTWCHVVQQLAPNVAAQLQSGTLRTISQLDAAMAGKLTLPSTWHRYPELKRRLLAYRSFRPRPQVCPPPCNALTVLPYQSPVAVRIAPQLLVSRHRSLLGHALHCGTSQEQLHNIRGLFSVGVPPRANNEG